MARRGCSEPGNPPAPIMVPLADEGRAEKRPYGDAAPTEQERNAASSHSRGAAHSTRPRASIGHKASIRVTAYAQLMVEKVHVRVAMRDNASF
jgi:hypothetical protein